LSLVARGNGDFFTMILVARGNGDFFTMINFGVLSYEVTKYHFRARCQGVSLQFP
jgi:hypothetical protein